MVAAQLEQFSSPSAGRRDLVNVLTNRMWPEWWATPPAHLNRYQCPALLLLHTHHLASVTQTKMVPWGLSNETGKIWVPARLQRAEPLTTGCFPLQLSCTAKTVSSHHVSWGKCNKSSGFPLLRQCALDTYDSSPQGTVSPRPMHLLPMISNTKSRKFTSLLPQLIKDTFSKEFWNQTES